MKLQLFSILLLIVIAVTYVNCNGMENKKYEWLPTECAPKMYPVWIVSGYFSSEEKIVAFVPNYDFVDNGWGKHGSTELVGSELKLLPDELFIEWFSFTENKFYKGTFSLPKDTIIALMERGFPVIDKRLHQTYRYLLVGLAPGGTVAVWLRSSDGWVTEVGHYQAEEITRTLESFLGELRTWGWVQELDMDPKDVTQEDFRNSFLYKNESRAGRHLDSIQGKIPFGLWDKYREKFLFRVRMDYDDPTAVTDMVLSEYYNGEEESVQIYPQNDNGFKMRARIRFFNTYWSFGRTLKETTVMMDETELMEAYNTLYEGNPNREIELRVHVNKENNFIRLWLSDPHAEYPKELELTKAYIKIYPVSETLRHRYLVFREEFKDMYNQ
ncbi:DUF2931 family protein [Dysgonomonas sp. GY617]|uniref:DUF2931 family protein n=1 Tax=Dysgonomonas sp. GY617 TaxID=2780420 RepID=UPI0018840AE0|nr:DUF2931 family protein [Dysgonomonas sp. GY617]MBF0576895.1 DUF2931 family protein [Dysgonomonas sp. GY617]